MRSTASTRRAAILLQASDTVVPSGTVRALDSLSFFTVLSPPFTLQISIPLNNTRSTHTIPNTTG